MGRDIHEEDRQLIMQEFDRARIHLAFCFTLKVSHLQELPWKILQISHSREVVAQLAARDVLQSTCTHPLAAELRGPFRTSCEAWLEGESVMTVDRQDLQTFVCVGFGWFLPQSGPSKGSMRRCIVMVWANRIIQGITRAIWCSPMNLSKLGQWVAAASALCLVLPSSSESSSNMSCSWSWVSRTPCIASFSP